MNKSKEPIHKPVFFRREADNTIVEVAIQNNEGYQG
jgi:DNA gyrase/topoisomerase IV subunit B